MKIELNEKAIATGDLPDKIKKAVEKAFDFKEIEKVGETDKGYVVATNAKILLDREIEALFKTKKLLTIATIKGKFVFTFSK